MVRRRTTYRRNVATFPSDFPERLTRLKEASGLSWRALARRLGTDAATVRRWRRGGVPSSVYLWGLFELGELTQHKLENRLE